jgi:AcrR family transcriptional regulator
MANIEEIIAAAARVFQRKGYHAATVQDIADAIGILKGSLYHHFKSKDDLLYLIVKEPILRMYSRIGEIAASDLPASEKLRRAILAHLDGFDQHYPHLFVYLREREEMKRLFRQQLNLAEAV